MTQKLINYQTGTEDCEISEYLSHSHCEIIHILKNLRRENIFRLEYNLVKSETIQFIKEKLQRTLLPQLLRKILLNPFYIVPQFRTNRNLLFLELLTKSKNILNPVAKKIRLVQEDLVTKKLKTKSINYD